MSAKLSFPITLSPAAGKRRRVHGLNAITASSGTSIGEKMILAAVVVALALLYAKGVTLMIDRADTPSPYTTFLNLAD
jgi:hypothetical protein